MLTLKFAELHTSLFHAGKNFGLKLDPYKLSGLSLVYDRENQELLVTYNDEVAIVPSSNIVSMSEGLPKQRGPAPVSHPSVSGVIKAQVGGPMDHVHAGPGHGKTGKDK